MDTEPRPEFDWAKREEALIAVLTPYLSPAQKAAALEQWEAALAARPELSERRPLDRAA